MFYIQRRSIFPATKKAMHPKQLALTQKTNHRLVFQGF
jgi:hypothetical protein